MAPQVATSPESTASREPKGSPIETPPKFAEELAKIPSEPFLPVEGRLVAWSVGLGAVLLVLLVWASNMFFAG